MKAGFIATIAFCCAFLHTFAQMPYYEYIPFQKEERAATVQLPDFTVTLKKEYSEEKTVYKQPPALFVVSDIEGQYEGFKQLLQAANVIDQQCTWRFGRGHLVICGDVFDRGSQVTECLWLIYHLEEQAKKAGGYVHYVLGNHEIMNLSGDLRFLNPKYLEFAKQKAVAYSAFFNDQTELGRWLRTKNSMEKIGDLLFLHGGVSQYINELGQPLDFINRQARSYYDKAEDSIPLLAQLLLLDYGPLWYRGYFMAPVASMAQIDSTLQLFGVTKIIIGHTPVEHVSTFYEGKIINVDVPHAKGSSEGLLIEDKKYYIVNRQGDKVPLSGK